MRLLTVARYRRFVAPLILCLLLLIVYFPTLHDFFASDDFVLLAQAAGTPSIKATFAIDPSWFFYRPLGKLVWYVTYHLWGPRSTLYHLLSLGLHGINALLLVWLITNLKDKEVSDWIPWGAGLLFALSPLQIETVVWSASLYDLLATSWYLVALLCLLAAWRERRPGFYILSLAAFQLCLWSKEVAFTFPILIVIIGLLYSRRPSIRSVILWTLPYGGLLLLNLLQRYLTWGNLGGYSDATTRNLLVGLEALLVNLRTMIVPVNQRIIPSTIALAWLILGTAGLVIGICLRLKSRLLWLAGLWLIVTLIPVTFLKVGDDLQNSRVLYLPSIGFYLGLAVALNALLQHWTIMRRQQLYGFGLICLLFLVVLRVQLQPWIFAGQETLHIVQELHRFVPVFRAQGKYQTRLQVIHLPDNYKGAYLYRIGLDVAFLQLYGSFFDVEQVPEFPPIRYAAPYATVQVAFDVNPATERWEIVRIRGVADGSHPDRLGPGAVLNWNFSNCAGTTGWTVYQIQQTCDQHGMNLGAETNDPMAVSPPVDFQKTGWTEVQITMARQAPATTPSALQLFWATADNLAWDEHNSETLALPTTQTLLRYFFFIPPGQQPVRQLRIDPLSTPGTATLQSVIVRSIP